MIIATESNVEAYCKYHTVANIKIKRETPIKKDKDGNYIDYCWFCAGIVKGYIHPTEQDIELWKKLTQ